MKDKLVLRAVAALFAAAAAVGFAAGCGSSASSGGCCVIMIGSMPECFCGSGAIDGTAYTVVSNGASCAITGSKSGQTESITGASATTCAGQPIACDSTDTSQASSTCKNSYTGCMDGKTYTFTCTSGSCTCMVNGSTTKTVKGSCGQENALCGWNVE